MTGGRALVEALAAHGVDTVFGIPGTHNLAAYAALADLGIRHVSPRHEQGAGYAADGYARSTGRLGVVLTTTGPAILNAAAAIAQAYSDSIPMLFVSPGMPSDHPGLGNGLLHEVKDQSAALNAIAHSHRVASVAEIPLAVAQAVTRATAGRPRPVHLEIPLDLLDAVAEARIVQAPPACPGAADEGQLRAAAHALTTAATPLVIIGGGAAGAAEEVRRLAERLEAPVITTTNGKGTLPEDHPLAVGAGVQHPAVLSAVESSDCILAIGTELAPSDWWIGLPELSDRLLRIDIDPLGININATPAHALVGDARRTIEALLQLLPTRAKRTGPDARTLRAAHRRDALAEGEPWVELIDSLAAALPRDAIVAADSAMVCYYGALSNLPLYRPRGFLYPTGGGTLGYGLPAGIGAKVANPAAPVIVLQGDGGTMFTVAELATAAELRLPLPIIVVDNGGYGEIRNEMADRSEPVHAVALGSPDFVLLAQALGCHGTHLRSATGLGRAVKQALVADRPTLIHLQEHSRAATGMRARGDEG